MDANAKIIYELNATDLNEVLNQRFEAINRELVLGRFKDRLVSVNTVAEIHDVHRETVIKYAKLKLIPYIKTGKLYQFSLAAVLQFDFNDLRRTA